MFRRQLLTLLLSLSFGVATWSADKKLLLIGQGPDNHPKLTHEYLPGMRIVEKLLQGVKGLEITVVSADGAWREGPELIERSDGVVLFVSEGGQWMNDDPRRKEALKRLVARGGGVVGLHWGLGVKEAKHVADVVDIFGACHGGPDRKYQVAEVKFSLPHGDHPILAGIKPFEVKDEFYYQLKVKPYQGRKPLLMANLDGKPEMVCWAVEHGDGGRGGRSFGFTGLHFHERWERLEYRRLIAQAVLWTLKLPIPDAGLKADLVPDDLNAERGQPIYEFRKIHDPNGTGKFFMGREIALVMGHLGASWLERPEREKEEAPKKLLKALDLKPGMSIADIGAGSGYYTFRMSEIVGEKGKVFAVDIQPEMLAIMKRKAGTLRANNIDFVLNTTTDAKLPPKSVELILMVDVYHEFSHPWEMVRSMIPALKEKGRIVFVEFRAEDPKVPIKEVHKMTEAQVKKEMSVHPLTHVATLDPLPWQHIVVFEKKVESPEPPK